MYNLTLWSNLCRIDPWLHGYMVKKGYYSIYTEFETYSLAVSHMYDFSALDEGSLNHNRGQTKNHIIVHDKPSHTRKPSKRHEARTNALSLYRSEEQSSFVCMEEQAIPKFQVDP